MGNEISDVGNDLIGGASPTQLTTDVMFGIEMGIVTGMVAPYANNWLRSIKSPVIRQATSSFATNFIGSSVTNMGVDALDGDGNFNLGNDLMNSALNSLTPALIDGSLAFIQARSVKVDPWSGRINPMSNPNLNGNSNQNISIQIPSEQSATQGLDLYNKMRIRAGLVPIDFSEGILGSNFEFNGYNVYFKFITGGYILNIQSPTIYIQPPKTTINAIKD